MANSVITRKKSAAIRKRVWSDVQNAHHQRARTQFQAATAQVPDVRRHLHGADCIIWPSPMRQPRVLFALCLLLIAPLHAASPKKPVTTESVLSAQIKAVVNQPQMASALWGIDVVDLESGKTIYSLNPDHLFLPASNVKLP